MITRPRSAVSVPLLLLILGAATAAPAPAATIEREFRYDASRFSLVEKHGEGLVGMKGATREFSPGMPDLPILEEMVELPEGMRVTSVEVTALDGAVLSASYRVPTAVKVRPGLEPIERTEADPAYYRRSGFPPASEQVSLGYQGWMRGRHLASLRVSPTRWDPSSGRLERIARINVRLTLEPFSDPDLVPRERIVPEWESSRPVVAPEATAPVSRQAEPFKPTQIPSVLGSPVAYLIITSDALAAAFQPLADWKTQAGVPAVVRTLSFIRQQYPYGSDDADRIRQFIRDAYSRWGTKWVLLGGDTDVIPERLAFTTFYVPGGEHIPCDMYFSCLDGNWNADGDSEYGEGPSDACDLLPEVYVGRAPVTTVSDVQLFVTKNFQYTRSPLGNYEHQIMFFAEVLFPQDWVYPQSTSLDGAEVVEDALPYMNANPNVRYLRLYQNHTDARWAPGALPESRAAVLDSLSAGYNMAVHVGHGYRNVMSCGDLGIDNADVTALTNGNRLSNVYAIDCTSNAIDFPCIGEAFMNAPNGGAVTNIGSTRFDFPAAGRAYQEEYFRVMFEDSITAVGEAQARQKIPFVGIQTVSDGLHRWTQMTLLMLGDPELHQWTSAPRTLTVTKPSTYSLTDTTMLVNVKIGATPLGGAKVTLYKAGDDYRSATTNASGNAQVEFRPGSTGSFTVTVTGFNCRPYQTTMTVASSSGAALADLTPVIDDDSSGGTSGNNNGAIDAGEVVDIRVPVINRGGSSASVVAGTLTTTDGLVTIVTPSVSYGTIAASATANGSSWYRMSIPAGCPDQRELPMRLDLVDNAGHHFVQRFTLTVLATEPRHVSHTLVDSPGNGDGIPNAGETITMTTRIRNLGTGSATSVTAVLRDYDGLATVTDSTAAFGTIAAGQEVAGDALVYTVGSTAAVLELRISDNHGLLFTQRMDLVRPGTPTALVAIGSQSSISLTWTRSTAGDLQGYSIHRSNSSGGPFTKVTVVPTDRTSYYQDEGLAPLTPYFYKVAAVDSSGNESALSLAADASTNPPTHTIFPVEMGRETPANVAVDYVYQPTMADIFAGSDVIWAWHADGTPPIEADGTPLTYGDFTTRGRYYAAGVSLARLDGTNWSVIGPAWDSTRVYVFDLDGNVRAGWPFVFPDGVWSAVAVGDLNNDGSSELVFGSNGNKLYALRANGTEWLDGDANPATQGVFKVLGDFYNYGTPALADLDGNGQLDIVYAGFEGKLFAWRPDGTDLPGFPVTVGSTTSSAAIGYLDGISDTQPEVVVTSANDSLYVFKRDGGRKSGFPIGIHFSGQSKVPSPAIADMNNDGFNDVVVAGTDGKIYVFDRNGALSPAFANVRYSNIMDGTASQSSPVVADINGDGLPDIVMGDENGVLNGISGTGQVLPGFPIQLGGEVRGAPALCDCDGDGMSEIVVSAWDKKTYMWDYDFQFSPYGRPPWPQFHHDARRTGFASSPVFLDAPAPGSVAGLVRIELSPPEPNPARDRVRVHWAVPAGRSGEALELGVYDLAGRRLATIASGAAREGRFAADWDLRDTGAARVGNGIYFLRFRLGAEAVSQKLVVMH